MPTVKTNSYVSMPVTSWLASSLDLLPLLIPDENLWR